VRSISLRFLWLGLLLPAVLVLSVMVGAVPVPAAAVYKAIVAPDQTNQTTIVRDMRLPRALTGALVGAALAVSGAVMQAATRNPLAAPGVAGVSAGASVAVIALTVFGKTAATGTPLALAAFAGAAVGGGMVFAMASGKGATPVRLALAGVAVSALLAAVGSGITMLNEANISLIIAWSTGGLDGRFWPQLRFLWPYVAVGLLMAWVLSRRLDIMKLGDDVATGLGLNMAWARAGALAVTVVLAGAAVAVAGPIGFVGLMVPHVARRLFGVKHAVLLPACALLGALLLTTADIGARLVMRPEEVPVGILTAVLGGPFFLYLVRKEAR
jgi:ABC-type Fe3+-siderophore transport system permease subunit